MTDKTSDNDAVPLEEEKDVLDFIYQGQDHFLQPPTGRKPLADQLRELNDLVKGMALDIAPTSAASFQKAKDLEHSFFTTPARDFKEYRMKLSYIRSALAVFRSRKDINPVTEEGLFWLSCIAADFDRLYGQLPIKTPYDLLADNRAAEAQKVRQALQEKEAACIQ